MDEELPTYEVEEISLEEAVEILAQVSVDGYVTVTNDSSILPLVGF